ncbi:hypothetical protein K2173_005534 [Erythroxylum novogranatense]|uniref:glutamate-1-semialdehyde 2,1-aminomutase n=1 Tax=Erythroxylum novogranatense TaxID=1862640 RepID=A0AAV8SKS0_9ROSI|nr:hypothetical protein K2173_005534 [Erythroxylum novogranatense]
MVSGFTGVGVELDLSCSTSKLLRSQTSPSRSSRCFRKKKSFTLQKSGEIFNAAKELMPGGVNSPVRAFKSVGGQPIVMDSVKGSHMWDVDGNECIDYVGSWGPAIIGHADDDVLAALAETMKKGTSFGAPCPLENVLAEMVIKAVPSIEMVRFVNSGTEACMGLLCLARAFAGKEKVIKFEDCYHGHADPFLIKAGSGVATLGLPDSPDVPKEAVYETLTAPSINKEEIAALILEPAVRNSGFVPPKSDFLNVLSSITKEYNALLIFDEVMTGFRLSYGGAQEYFVITSDLKTLGKIMSGGPGWCLWREEGYHGDGTLSGNPLAMTAGIHMLKRLQKPGSYRYLDKITKQLIEGILDARKAGHAMCSDYISGKFGFFFTEGPFTTSTMQREVTLPISAFEAGFTSLAHTPEDIEHTIAAAAKVFQQI